LFDRIIVSPAVSHIAISLGKSPYLFTRYIRELIGDIVSAGIGGRVYGQVVNVLAYADDMVLLASSWRTLPRVISILSVHATSLDLKCNTIKAVAMVFDPKTLAKLFRRISNCPIQNVTHFKYLGHIISNSANDEDI